ncbi:drug/metabolite transporter (DMT)-like permease [Parabacteroides sp. PF5-5]|uniref:DMT family transporter n=1 Tax=unclassified Parabacteroides TaxID=2649774 RepID=UPI002475E119|nr:MULTISPECIES: DMT family transporter [unclassified Parabacteroides]MDH6304534.1 drug/metabolite transporter (DMT)-like permease [Parabacteroides sp. PH5-39]MDH6315314.1 drug/metabolite transporter (DMT)-like permease [Parabacteroides sp. PF5-13]MDH6319192.1 drug/metabolite transporter (DMT)-like permease [Parabacteroides sp. PH5-13]MDH6322923.1 drug/metabolite transporter (DMT)-like permease [Parabacteroides sp. PH5-8]MDH6326505.1 drug/metabolite transporter (DMT)-like permease [Parabactero
MLSKEKLKGHVLIFSANVLFGINMPVSKYLLPGHVVPEALTIMRMLFACVMFWLVSLFMKQEKVPLKDIGLLFLCGMCGIAFNQSLFISGLSQTSPVDASIIATAGPIFVMLLAALILKEPITKLKTLGVMIGATGGILLILSSTQASNQASSLQGDLKIVFSGFIYSIYVVISKPLSQRYSSVTIMKWMFLFSTLVLLPFMYRQMLDTDAFHRSEIDWKEASAIFYVLMGATFIPYLMIPMALKRIRPTTLSMYNYVQPIVASLIAVMVGQDSFTLSKILSSALVFVGVYMVTQSKSREDVEKELKIDS